jgi:hypothetical protein
MRPTGRHLGVMQSLFGSELDSPGLKNLHTSAWGWDLREIKRGLNTIDVYRISLRTV